MLSIPKDFPQDELSTELKPKEDPISSPPFSLEPKAAENDLPSLFSFLLKEARETKKVHSAPAISTTLETSFDLDPQMSLTDESTQDNFAKIGMTSSIDDEMSSKDDSTQDRASEIYETALTPQLFFTLPQEIASTTPAIQILPPSILDCIERLGGAMTIMDHNGLRETSFIIEDSASPLKGTEIFIREYSTAPKAFNIELSGHPEATALFQTHLPTLLATFKNGNFQFFVSRIDISCIGIEESPRTRRKKVTAAEEKLT